jgi:hypothetical protein
VKSSAIEYPSTLAQFMVMYDASGGEAPRSKSKDSFSGGESKVACQAVSMLPSTAPGGGQHESDLEA